MNKSHYAMLDLQKKEKKYCKKELCNLKDQNPIHYFTTVQYSLKMKYSTPCTQTLCKVNICIVYLEGFFYDFTTLQIFS